MNEKIKKHLIAYSKATWPDLETTDEDLMEIITDAKSIWEGRRDRHRWYTLIPRVVEIDGMFLQYAHCDVDGEESSVEDCIGGYKLEDVIEVKPQDKVETTYVPA